MKKILVTGGAGYIGSHTCIELLNAGYEVVVVDNFVNSSKKSLERVEEITGKKITTYQIDCCNRSEYAKVFDKEKFNAVIHFAGLKAVGESVDKPLEYYHNNIISMVNTIEIMREYKVHNLVFSSSACVYGDPKQVPIYEDFPLSATSPYGRTKLIIEDILRDFSKANPEYNIAILRYFNPIGAHPSGKIGEDPNGIPNNLMPYITQVAIGKLPFLRVFGNDYPTPDGTGIRDYIHVCDLAIGHLCAVKKLMEGSGLVTYNIGTGVGYSVFEILLAMERAVGNEIPYKIVPRRSGDIAMCYSNCDKAKKELDFETKYSLEDMCQTSWNWQKNNPNGFER